MASARTCRFCQEALADCICEDDPVTFPPGSGRLLAAALGADETEPGPPYTHRHQFPPEQEEDELFEPPPPPYTITGYSE